jgi:hypothetical protein
MTTGARGRFQNVLSIIYPSRPPDAAYAVQQLVNEKAQTATNDPAGSEYDSPLG